MDESTNSCGTTSCRSTEGRKAVREDTISVGGSARMREDAINMSGPNRMREDTVSVDGPALLRELERLRSGLASLLGQKIAEKRARVEGSGERILVLSCLARGLSLQDWHDLCENCTSPEDWFAFELDPARNPQLAASSARGVPLQQAVCPETGLLLAPVFTKNMGSELDKARKTGNGPTLVLFEIVDGTCRPDPRPTGTRRSEPTLTQIFSGNVDPDVLEKTEPVPQEMPPPQPLPADKSRVARLPLLAQTLRAHARGCDVPARMEDSLALLMPGAGALRARAFAERLVLAFDEALRRVSGGQVVRLALRAGIAGCEIDDIPDAGGLLARAQQAMALAQPGGTRTWRKNDMGVSERKTQVQACEKQFLFFGAAGVTE